MVMLLVQAWSSSWNCAIRCDLGWAPPSPLTRSRLLQRFNSLRRLSSRNALLNGVKAYFTTILVEYAVDWEAGMGCESEYLGG
jgi:hypothetical protein